MYARAAAGGGGTWRGTRNRTVGESTRARRRRPKAVGRYAALLGLLASVSQAREVDIRALQIWRVDVALRSWGGVGSYAAPLGCE